jgi:hypothetical protein
MTVRTYALISGILFLLVAILHLVRVIMQENVLIGSWHFPMWASIVAIVVSGFLSFVGFRIYQAQRVSLFR